MKKIYTTIMMIFLGGCTSIDKIESMPTLHEITKSQDQRDIFDGFMKERVSENRGLSITREEQVQLALDAAVTDRVIPILLEKPVKNDVYFEFSDSKVSSKWTSLLQQHVDYLHTDSSLRVLIAGFTDQKGSAKYNLRLGQRRSTNVCNKMIELGARKEQLTCVSYGESHPKYVGPNESMLAKNRRVEILY